METMTRVLFLPWRKTRRFLCLKHGRDVSSIVFLSILTDHQPADIEGGAIVYHRRKQPERLLGVLLTLCVSPRDDSLEPYASSPPEFTHRAGKSRQFVLVFRPTYFHTQMFPAAVKAWSGSQGQTPASAPRGNHFYP
ncbi:hypothetical protein JOB18_020944 [Solea senegalensis]|uniref:Uncharacterized protein n=1 Tax=Solea senegalensis TaxID=28829 RepID=A0AAV6RBR1_SOLSE|nr:hypothetical protein JOB18_020944 [Solea senegalensis]